MGRITFTADQKFTAVAGEVTFTSAPAGRTQLLEFGLAYYTAAAANKQGEMEQLITDNGSLFIRRALMTFARMAGNRYGERDVQKAAMALRAQIPARGNVVAEETKHAA